MGTRVVKGKGEKPMKRKTLLTLLILTISATLLSGCKTSDSVDNSEVKNETTESTEITAIESESLSEPTETSETASTEPAGQDSLTDEITDNIVYPDVNPEDVDPKTTNMDGDTAIALSKKENAEICDKYGSVEAYDEYVKSQGADGSMGWCWVYDTGKGAGSEESYAVYMKEDSPRKGEVFHLGDYLPNGTLFTGANNDEMSTADNRVLLRMSENGELGGTTVTQDENGMLNIVVE